MQTKTHQTITILTQLFILVILCYFGIKIVNGVGNLDDLHYYLPFSLNKNWTSQKILSLVQLKQWQLVIKQCNIALEYLTNRKVYKIWFYLAIAQCASLQFQKCQYSLNQALFLFPNQQYLPTSIHKMIHIVKNANKNNQHSNSLIYQLNQNNFIHNSNFI